MRGEYVKLVEMMSLSQIDLNKVDKKSIDKEILRTSIIAELDAINLYEQFAAKTTDKNLKKLLLNIAKEEKTHIGELETFLTSIDKEQEQELKNGKKEVDDLNKK